MNYALLLRLCLIALIPLWLSSCASSETEVEEDPKPTNFVFILVDDLGWTDIGAFGSSFYETPNIDRLAAEGMRFAILGSSFRKGLPRVPSPKRCFRPIRTGNPFLSWRG